MNLRRGGKVRRKQRGAVIVRSPGRLRSETINEFVKLIEGFQGHPQQVRPENNFFSMAEAEGYEIQHLRELNRSMGLNATDEELAAMSLRLREAVRTSVKRIEESRSSGDVKATAADQ